MGFPVRPLSAEYIVPAVAKEHGSADGDLAVNIFVLTVADGQHALAMHLGHHEFKAADRRIDGNERNRAVVVLPARHPAFPGAEIEHHVVAIAPDRQVPQLGAGVSTRQLRRDYDITFTAQADPWKRRRKRDRYEDFCMLPESVTDDIVFLGGKDYLPLFCTLTNHIRAPKTVFYNLKERPHFPGYNFKRFETSTRTNWHYECAAALIDGAVAV